MADLSDRLAELLPKATVLQVQERVGNRRLAAVEEQGEAGAEPTLDEHFRTYLETQGTKGAAADRVLEVFRAMVQALEHEEEPRFADEAALLEELPDASAPSPPPLPPPLQREAQVGAAEAAPTPRRRR
jgi:hypothetical protein